MIRPVGLPSRDTAGLLLAAAAAPGALALAGAAREGWPPAAAWSDGLALLAAAACGRAALALLPPGPVGRHGAADLGATAAASLLLGLALLGALRAATAAASGAPAGRALLVPFALLAAARVATLPGAMVPRHDPREEQRLGAARAAGVALALALALVGVASAAGTAPPPLLGALDSLSGGAAGSGGAGASALAPAAAWAAAVLLLGHGLRVTRRSPAQRAGLAALVAALPAAAGVGVPGAHGGALAGAALLCGGAAFGAQWLRRADRRARALALACLAALPLASGAGLVLAALGLALLAAFTPRPSRGSAALACAAAWGLASWPLARAAALPAGEPVAPAELLAALADGRAFGAAAALVAAGVVVALARLPRRARPAPTGDAPARTPPADELRVEPPRRELAYALALSALSLAALQVSAGGAEQALLAWLPTGALAAGMGVLAPERPLRRAGER